MWQRRRATSLPKLIRANQSKRFRTHSYNSRVAKTRALWGATLVLLAAAALHLWQITSLPAGLHYDEAYHALQAQSVLGGNLRLYFTENQGNEPAIIYLTAAAVQLLGNQTWSGRLAASLAGLLTIALLVPAGRRSAQPTDSRASAGLLAATCLCGLQWHLNISRFGSQPVLAALAAAGTLWGWRAGMQSGRRRHFAAAGLFCALGLYSYGAARVLPLALLGAAAAQIGLRAQPARAWRGLLLCAAVCAAAYAPLAVWFGLHPGWFTNRLLQVYALQSVPASFARMFGGLLWRGDDNWVFNLPRRPALDGLQLMLFAAATAGSAWHLLAQKSSSAQRASVATLWIFLLCGLLPAALAPDAPHWGRAAGALPALALLLALGAMELQRWLAAAGGPRLALLVPVLCMASIGITAQSYFQQWGANHNLYMAFGAGDLQLAQRIKLLDAEVYVSPLALDHPTLRYVLGSAIKRVHSYDSAACDLWPANAAPFTFASALGDGGTEPPFVRGIFPGGSAGQPIMRGDFPYIVFWQVPAGSAAHLPDWQAVEKQIGGFAQLRGYQMVPPDTAAPALLPNAELSVDLYWQALAPSAQPATVFVHLLRSDTSPPQLLAGTDQPPCRNHVPTPQWRTGDMLRDRISLPLPARLPAGTYELSAGMYVSASGERLPVSGGESALSARAVRLQNITVP